jgi:hypothetical protein
MKAIVAQDDGRILGFAMIGAEAGDVKPRSWQTSVSGTPLCRSGAPDNGSAAWITV